MLKERRLAILNALSDLSWVEFELSWVWVWVELSCYFVVAAAGWGELGQIWANLGSTWASLASTWANLDGWTWANSSQIRTQLGPTWDELAQIGCLPQRASRVPMGYLVPKACPTECSERLNKASVSQHDKALILLDLNSMWRKQHKEYKLYLQDDVQ